MADWPDVILETIKIIGVPGLVGVIATYRGTRAQIDAKLAEIQQQNEFNARRQLFELYKEQQTKHEDKTFKFTELLGKVLGQIAGGMDDKGFISTYNEFISLSAGQLPMWLRLTRQEMDQHALTATEPYRRLVGYIEHELVLEPSDSASSLRKNILAVMEVMMCQHACQSLISDAQFRQVFAPYMALHEVVSQSPRLPTISYEFITTKGERWLPASASNANSAGRPWRPCPLPGSPTAACSTGT